jgi:hypothetical protein
LGATVDGFAGRGVDYSPRTAWSTGAAAVGLFGITVLLLTGLLGCQDRTSFIPNSDPALRKTKSEFARDAMQRQPYHADAPRGGKLNGRASADYGDDNLLIANLSAEDWTKVEVWVNQQYVVFVPKIEGHAASAKTIDFTMMYDRMGRPFPSENKSPESMVHKVEIYRDGKMYELSTVAAD